MKRPNLEQKVELGQNPLIIWGGTRKFDGKWADATAGISSSVGLISTC